MRAVAIEGRGPERGSRGPELGGGAMQPGALRAPANGADQVAVGSTPGDAANIERIYSDPVSRHGRWYDLGPTCDCPVCVKRKEDFDRASKALKQAQAAWSEAVERLKASVAAGCEKFPPPAK